MGLDLALGITVTLIVDVPKSSTRVLMPAHTRQEVAPGCKITHSPNKANSTKP